MIWVGEMFRIHKIDFHHFEQSVSNLIQLSTCLFVQRFVHNSLLNSWALRNMACHASHNSSSSLEEAQQQTKEKRFSLLQGFTSQHKNVVTHFVKLIGFIYIKWTSTKIQKTWCERFWKIWDLARNICNSVILLWLLFCWLWSIFFKTACITFFEFLSWSFWCI